jgi:CRISPR-associated protein Cas2
LELLVTYDVATSTEDGERRLRRVAQACQSFGQRVQKSVFECTVNEMDRERLVARLLDIIDEDYDSLRIYRLTEPRERHVQVYGLDHYVDFKGPLLA